jgi:hypothetical protein
MKRHVDHILEAQAFTSKPDAVTDQEADSVDTPKAPVRAPATPVRTPVKPHTPKRPSPSPLKQPSPVPATIEQERPATDPLILNESEDSTEVSIGGTVRPRRNPKPIQRYGYSPK